MIPSHLLLATIKRVTVMLPDDVHLELKLHSVKDQKTLNDCFIEAINMYMQHRCNSVEMDSKSADLSD
jgi:hypothetical protein